MTEQEEGANSHWDHGINQRQSHPANHADLNETIRHGSNAGTQS